jgi:cell wall-associated NlpC family hydrolase
MRMSLRPNPVHVVAGIVAAATVTGALVATTPAGAVVSSTMSLSTSASRVRVGTPVTLAAHLQGPLGAVADAPVTFYCRSGSGAWHTVVDPASSPVRTVTVYRPQPQPTFGERVVREAARHEGAPYQYGAAGPDAFDCSGFTMYVFGRFGIRLPHNAQAQYDAVRHVPPSGAALGDLVFFRTSSGIYHVGIYAGHGRMWAAPHSGDHVRLEAISSSYLVGRAD